jgi:hypothetical protein
VAVFVDHLSLHPPCAVWTAPQLKTHGSWATTGCCAHQGAVVRRFPKTPKVPHLQTRKVGLAEVSESTDADDISEPQWRKRVVYGRKRPGACSQPRGGRVLIFIFLAADVRNKIIDSPSPIVPHMHLATNKTTPVGGGPSRTNTSIQSIHEAVSTPVRARRASAHPNRTPPPHHYLMGDNQRSLSLSLPQSSARTCIRKRKSEPSVPTAPAEEQENEPPVCVENTSPVS